MKKTIATLLLLCLYFYGCSTNEVQDEDGMTTWKSGHTAQADWVDAD